MVLGQKINSVHVQLIQQRQLPLMCVRTWTIESCSKLCFGLQRFPISFL